MSRMILVLVILIHGLIHLMGFAKEYQLADIKELTGKTLFPMSASFMRIAGVAWLFVCMLFLAAVVMLAMQNDMWWAPALPALLLSQLLIILYWPDAKFGTLANIIILITCLPAIGNWKFNHMLQGDIDNLLALPAHTETRLTDDALDTVPPLIQKWMRQSQVVGKLSPTHVYLTQTGSMRTSADGKWMPFHAEQYFSVPQPGFIWSVKV